MLGEKFKIGTLISDKGKIGIIYRQIDSGDLDIIYNSIKWRLNYEIYYLNGDIVVMGAHTLRRLINNKQIKIIKESSDNLSKNEFKKNETQL